MLIICFILVVATLLFFSFRRVCRFGRRRLGHLLFDSRFCAQRNVVETRSHADIRRDKVVAVTETAAVDEHVAEASRRVEMVTRLVVEAGAGICRQLTDFLQDGDET